MMMIKTNPDALIFLFNLNQRPTSSDSIPSRFISYRLSYTHQARFISQTEHTAEDEMSLWKNVKVYMLLFIYFLLIAHLFSACLTPPASPISWREVTRFVTAGFCCLNVKGYGWRATSVASTPANSAQVKGRAQSLLTNWNRRFSNDGSYSAQWDACESFRTRKFFRVRLQGLEKPCNN